MSEYIIPPMTDVGPVMKVNQVENGYKATIGYTAQAIDEMVRRVNEKLDEEMMARLAEQHGYVRVVRCRDCKHVVHRPEWQPDKRFKPIDLWVCEAEWCMGFEGDHPDVTPDGFCSFGERKEGGDD